MIDKADIREKSFWTIIGNLNKKTMIPILLVTLLLMVAIFIILNPIFISFNNIINMMIYIGIPGIVAFGVSTVLLGRNVDLSVGSIIAISAIVASNLNNLEGIAVPLPIIIIIVILVGIIIGSINGALISYLGVNSVIITLGTLTVFRGIAYLYIYFIGPQIVNYAPFQFIGRGILFDWFPMSFILMVVIFVVLYLILKLSRFGRHIYATGGNPLVAKLYGINVKKIHFISFVISGITASIAGLLIASQLGGAVGDIGLEYEFNALTIVVLGGISLRGGKGSIIGVLVAMFIYGIISNGLTVGGVPIAWRETFLGLILIFAIIFDSVKNKEVQ